MRPIGRRGFTKATGCALASVAFGNACVVSTQSERSEGRVNTQPRNAATTLQSGPIGLGQGGRDGLIQMPSSGPTENVPLLVFLHGASQRGESMLPRVGAIADRMGVALVLPDSRGMTWDAVTGVFGEDVEFLRQTLDSVFARLNVDPARVAIGGFSDGATYALSLGLANGDLFSHVMACSPGFVFPAAAHGRPRFFVSHGIADQVLPIDRCSRVIVPRLKAMGYDVTYREFEGRHEVPPAIATEAMEWMTGAARPA